VSGRLVQRKQRAHMHAEINRAGKHPLVSIRFLRKIALLGGLARAARINPSWRRGIARKAALARWHRSPG
jgi:hypothetical protein